MRSTSAMAAAGAIVLLAATACSSAGTPTSVATSNAASPSVGPESSDEGQANVACSGSDVAAALAAAASAVASAVSYRIDGTATTSTGDERYTLEFAKPDSVHAILGEMEFIAIGDTTWRKSSGGWEAAPGVDLSTLTAGMGQLNQELLDTATFSDVSVDRNAQVDGQAAVLYRYHESIPPELEADSQMWLDPSTCRPIRNVATSTASNATSQIDVRFSDWGSVTIQPPA